MLVVNTAGKAERLEVRIGVAAVIVSNLSDCRNDYLEMTKQVLILLLQSRGSDRPGAEVDNLISMISYPGYPQSKLLSTS